MDKKNIAIISADKEIIELAIANNYNVCGIFDKNKYADSLGIKIIGDDNEWPNYKINNPDIKLVISIDQGKIKQKLVEFYGESRFIGLISVNAYISHFASIASTCIVQMGTKIMTKASVGKFCKINVNSTVHHDCVVGDFCTLAPGATLLGTVTIGNRVFVGAGAILLPYVKVGDDVVIGAGAVVTKNIKSGKTIAGVPARELYKEK